MTVKGVWYVYYLKNYDFGICRNQLNEYHMTIPVERHGPFKSERAYRNNVEKHAKGREPFIQFEFDKGETKQ